MVFSLQNKTRQVLKTSGLGDPSFEIGGAMGDNYIISYYSPAICGLETGLETINWEAHLYQPKNGCLSITIHVYPHVYS